MEKKIYNYCKAVIEDFQLLERLAMRNIDKMRCPLYMACPELYNEMETAIEDFCEDNEIENEFDPEEILLAR